MFSSRFQLEKESTRLNVVHFAADRRGRIAVGDRIAQSSNQGDSVQYVVKLRPDGSSSFLRWFEGDVALGALTADAGGRLWLGGSARVEVWADGGERAVVTGQGVLLLRLSP